MLDLGEWNACVCPRMGRGPRPCQNQYMVQEQGKAVKLEPKSSETVLAIVLDACVMQDNTTKCDALFVYRRPNGKWAFLVELKGAGEMEKAFDQLSQTRRRSEYNWIVQQFANLDPRRVKEQFVVVSNGIMGKAERERLEEKYGLRVHMILHREPTRPVPDLRSECL